MLESVPLFLLVKLALDGLHLLRVQAIRGLQDDVEGALVDEVDGEEEGAAQCRILHGDVGGLSTG